MPEPDVERINQAPRRTLTNDAVAAKLSASGAEPAPSKPGKLAALLENDAAKWSRVIKVKKQKARKRCACRAKFWAWIQARFSRICYAPAS